MDGRWTYSDQTTQATEAAEGRLTASQQDGLSAAVDETRLSGITASTGCQADSDGTSVRYAWSGGATSGSASTCGPGLDESDPLVVAVEALVDELNLR